MARYLSEFRQRLPEFKREHNAELRQIGTDFIGRMFHEYVLFGEKTDCEAFLHAMLTPEERDRLQTDRKFTQAWQVFVDLYWLRKRSKRALLMLGVILAVFGLLFLVGWAVQYWTEDYTKGLRPG